jgi:PhnB protein
MAKINPYLNFGGNAEEAFNFYRSVFGGEFAGVLRWKDMPKEGCEDGGDGEHQGVSEADGEKIMHIALPIGGGNVLMASDTLEGFGPPLAVGNNFYIAIAPESKDEADRLFADLSAGGAVEMPMADAFWGGYFGSFKDKFGIGWLINYDNAQGKDVNPGAGA